MDFLWNYFRLLFYDEENLVEFNLRSGVIFVTFRVIFFSRREERTPDVTVEPR